MDYDLLSSRLSQLREEKNISAREMSLAIGQSASYINKIENQKAYPSMQIFFYICEFLGVTPTEFFSSDVAHPILIQEALVELKKLNKDQLKRQVDLLKDINHS
ncbi:MAG: helix-turn-helix transcriptional regulator [Eubacteriales bacterium]